MPEAQTATEPAVDSLADEHRREVEAGRRFEFGKNWQRFLSVLDEDRIREAEASLRNMMGVETLLGTSFLDIGSGSGLFSLAARRLGARVHSFDYDPQSVACGLELKRRYFSDDSDWTIERGSALDAEYLGSLGKFDVVYSWGVLHHTGDMWAGLENALLPLAPGGRLFIALYNDQGVRSTLWRWVKRAYCSGSAGRKAVVAVFYPYFFLQGLVADIARLRNPLQRYREYRRRRGMSVLRDWRDWLGGYPFEVARPKEIIEYYAERGLSLEKLAPTRALGNNQFIFRAPPPGSTPQ